MRWNRTARWTVAIVAVCCLTSPLYAQQAQNRPNIVLVFIDDMGWTDAGCFGSTLYETPAIDRLRAGDYKLIQWYGDGSVELYNLEDDLSERHDLAPTMPTKAAELLKMLDDWRQSVDAEG